MSSTSEREKGSPSTKPVTYPEVGVKKPEEVAPPTPPTPTPTPPTPQPPTLPPELATIREKLGTIITDLIFCAQDVGFELAMLKCENRENCPLVKKTRELIMKVRELFELQREMTKRSR